MNFVSLTYKTKLKGVFMLKLLISFITGKSKIPLSDRINPKSETTEKKKCKNCLKRIDIDFIRCPICRSSEFYED